MCFRDLTALSCVLLLSAIDAYGQAETPEQIARRIRIPYISFKDSTPREAVDFLCKKGRDILGQGRTININYIGHDGLSPERANLSVRDIPLLEILQIVAAQTNLSIASSENGIYLYPVGTFPPEMNGLRLIGWSQTNKKAVETAIYSTGRKDAFVETQKLIEETFGDRFKAPKEVRDLIDSIKKRSDEAATRIRESNEKLDTITSESGRDGK